MGKTILVIHNPIAGRSRRNKLLKLLETLYQRGHKVVENVTTQRGDARDFARTCDNVDVIIAAGGDGTVNEVVEGLLQRKPKAAIPAVGFLPLGTANVLAWELALPRNPQAIVDMIEQGKTLPSRPGTANNRPFILMASVGLDARAVAAVKTATKRKIGGAAYVLAAFKALKEAPPSFTVSNSEWQEEAKTVIVTRAKKYGGPFTISPEAGLSRQTFQVILLQSYGILAALRYGLSLALGNLHRLPDVTVKTADQIRIEGPGGEPVQMDGDIVEQVPIDLKLADREIPFLVNKA